MGNRLSRIYTRTGDDGTTGMADGTRVPKDDARIVAGGDIDELNSVIGLARAEKPSSTIDNILQRLQHELFDLGTELSLPGRISITERHVSDLENDLDNLNSSLAPLKEFVLPGGTRLASLLHMARAVCRRAERSVCTLYHIQPASPYIGQYLNRLSDLLFVLARACNNKANHPETYWQSAGRESD